MKGRLWMVPALLFLLVGLGCAIAAKSVMSKPMFDPLLAYEEMGKDREGILAYKTRVLAKLERLRSEAPPEKEVYVTLTFARPLGQEEAADFMDRYNMRARFLMGRAIERKTGLRVTFTCDPEKIRDRAFLESRLALNDAEFKGFIELVADIPNRDLQLLKDDRLVFLADPSADAHFVFNPKRWYMPGLFWNLEEARMVNE